MMFREFITDVGYAFRGMERDRVLTIAAAITLAVAIGANTTMFSLANTILIRPLPYPDSGNIYRVTERLGRDPRGIAVGADYYSLREQNKVFVDVAAFDTFTMNWNGIEKPEALAAAQVTPSFFVVMGTKPMLGRYLGEGEERRSAAAVVVISYTLWRNRLGSDPGVVGKTILLNGSSNQIVGVMPQGFNYPLDTQIWKPTPMDDASQRPRFVSGPMRVIEMIARVKPEVSGPQLASELQRTGAAIRAEYPKDFEQQGFLGDFQFLATPLQRVLTGDLRPALLTLSGAVGLVLLIACANLANLLLARSATRQRELAVRMALGSSRGRVVRQLLAESLALAAPGGIAGVLIAFASVEALNRAQPLVLANHPPIVMDVRTLLFTLGLTVLTGLLFGLAPAFSAAGTSVQDTLKSASQHHTGRGASWLRRGLVVAELGISLVLLIGAGLLARSFVNLARVDLGFKPDNLLTMRVRLRGARYTTNEQQMGFYESVLAKMKQLPGVQAAAVSSDIALSGEREYGQTAYQVAGRSPVPDAQRPNAHVTLVSREFFATLGVPLRAGRVFNAEDSPRASGTVVVNEAFARQVFGGENPLGQRLLVGRDGIWTIAGVVGNIRGAELGAEPQPLIYRCTCNRVDPFETALRFIVRTDNDPRASLKAIESQVYAVDSGLPVFEVLTMEERLDSALAPRQFQLILIGVFAGIAIVLAAAGVYGVMSYLVTRQTREIGIRIALGARPGQVQKAVMRESLLLTCAAGCAGLGGAWALTRYLRAMLYGVSEVDSLTFGVMPLVLAVVAALAALTPARRAARVDPIVALREE